MNESSKSYLYGNPRLSAAEWRTNLDNTDTAETLQSMQDIDKTQNGFGLICKKTILQ